MKVKVSEAKGRVLDYLVAKCEGITFTVWNGRVVDAFSNPITYHDDWAQAGPIIEREGITLTYETGDWTASVEGHFMKYFDYSPLVAAMRCYVASKLGDEVEVTDERGL